MAGALIDLARRLSYWQMLFRLSKNQLTILDSKIDDLEMKMERYQRNGRRSGRVQARKQYMCYMGVRHVMYEFCQRALQECHLHVEKLMSMVDTFPETYQETTNLF